MRGPSLALLSLAALTFVSTAAADTMVWDVTGQNLFGTLNLTTGAFNQISDLGFLPAGLGQVDGRLYTALSGGYGLYTVNTMTGATSLVGNASLTYFAFGSTNSGLYMVDTVGTLWTIDPNTGTSSIVGSTHLNLMGVQSIALSAGSNTLYIALNNGLYTINTTTGLASFVGTSGSTDFGALVDVSGRVYANTIVSPNSVYTFNPATGVSSFVTLSSAGDYAYGLAPIVPEPASFALLGLGALVGAFALKRKRVIA